MTQVKYNIAVVGATGLVGETMIRILAERAFPIATLYPLASERSAGDSVSFGDKTLRVQALNGFDFEGVDIALFSAGAEVSVEFAPLAARSGTVVIDNTSAFRYEADIPLVIPEVNPQALDTFRERNIIANPNCSTIQMLLALHPLHQAYNLSSINVATYQSVSGAGQKAVSALAAQTSRLMNGLPCEDDLFGRQMAFNVIPQIDRRLENGFTREEMKMIWETRKIFDNSMIWVNPTAVRVPVFFGHSESIHACFQHPVDVDQARELLRQTPGVCVVDGAEPFEYATAVTHAAGKDAVFVSRLRADLDNEKGLNFWTVSDNIRKGAALNSIQIAELLVKMYL